jgi:hypothetical protein
MSAITFPPRRVDGVPISDATGSAIQNPSFNSVEITGPNVSFAGQTYQWPSLDGDPTNILINNGSNLLTWSDNTGAGILTLLQDFDANTRVETEQGANDDTIRFISNSVEVYNVTGTNTIIGNELVLSNAASLSTPQLTPLNYTVASSSVHLISNGFGYYVSGTDLIIIEVSNVATPVVMSTTNLGFISGGSITKYGDFLYIAEINGINNSYIVNIQNKISPTLIGTIPYVGIESFEIQGNLMYIVPDLLPRVVVLNILDQANPVEVSSTILPTTDRVSSLTAKGNYLYLFSYSNGDQSVLSYNIADPTSPVFLQKLVLNTVAAISYRYKHSVFKDNFLFASAVDTTGTNPHGPISINVIDSSTMSIASTLYTSDVDYAVFLGQYGYVISAVDNLIRLADITDPNALVYITQTYPVTGPLSFSVVGKYLFVNELPLSTLNIYETNSTYIHQLEVGNIKTNNVDVTGPITISKKLNVSGGMNIKLGFNAQGTSSISGDLNVLGSLAISGKNRRTIREVFSTTTLANDYAINFVNVEPILLNLPVIVSVIKLSRYLLVKLTSDSATINIIPSGGDTIVDPSTGIAGSSYLWTGNVNDIMQLMSNGSKWVFM